MDLLSSSSSSTPSPHLVHTKSLPMTVEEVSRKPPQRKALRYLPQCRFLRWLAEPPVFRLLMLASSWITHGEVQTQRKTPKECLIWYESHQLCLSRLTLPLLSSFRTQLTVIHLNIACCLVEQGIPPLISKIFSFVGSQLQRKFNTPLSGVQNSLLHSLEVYAGGKAQHFSPQKCPFSWRA